MKCHTSHNFGIWLCFFAVASLAWCASGASTKANAQTVPTYMWYLPADSVAYPYCETASDCMQTVMDTILANLQAKTPNNGASYYPEYVQNVSCTPDGTPTSQTDTSTCTGSIWCQGYTYNGTTYPSKTCYHTQYTAYGTATSQYPGYASSTAYCAGSSGTAFAEGLPTSSGPTISPKGCFATVTGDVCASIGAATTWDCTVSRTGAFEPPGSSTPTTTAPKTNSSNCQTSGNVTACAQTTGSGAGSCATVNGNQICPGAMPPDGCIGYQSGAVACTNTGGTATGEPTTSSGTPAPPAAQAGVATNSTTASNVTNYYTHTTVSSSSTVVQSSSTGQNVGNGGSGTAATGTTSGTGTSGIGGTVAVTPNAANGDCGASANSANCGTTGSPYPNANWSSDSWSGATQTLINGLEASPIGTATTSITNAWPSGGSCPAETVDLTTLHYTANYGTVFCGLWTQAALPVLEATMLAVWSIAAVIVFLST